MTAEGDLSLSLSHTWLAVMICRIGMDPANGVERLSKGFDRSCPEMTL